MNPISEEVQQVLSENQDIALEEVATEQASPLNQPVKEKEPLSAASPKKGTTGETTTGDKANDSFKEKGYAFLNPNEVDNVPEQEINKQPAGKVPHKQTDDFKVPTGHAIQAADAFLGMADNLIEVGGGWFVKVKKHKDFYDFDEIIQVIDEQNRKNLKRIKLDDEDRALLRPLLAAILKKRAKKLSPEQQLFGALISIIVKKAQVVMEVRAENELLVERILDIIREERQYPRPATTPHDEHVDPVGEESHPAPFEQGDQDEDDEEASAAAEEEESESPFPAQSAMEVSDQEDDSPNPLV